MALPATIEPASAARTDNPQRAAAFILALGSENADTLLEYLRPEEIAQLAEHVHRLSDYDERTRDLVLRDAVKHMLSIDPTHEANLLRQKALAAAQKADQIAPFDPHEPFGFLKKVELNQVVQYLKGEHPQTVAVVLSHQSSAFAASILERFDEDMAADVSLRIATIGRTNDGVLENIEMAMRRRLQEEDTTDLVEAVDGAKELASILNSIERTVEEHVLESINNFDPELAERVRSLMFVFEDIVTLPDRAIQVVLQAVDTKTLAMSIKGSTAEVRQAIERNLSERARQSLTEETDLLGSVRKSDVHEARNAVVGQIRVLEASGQIVIARGDDGEFIE